MEDTGPVPVRLSGVRGRACRQARGPQGVASSHSQDKHKDR